MSKKTNWTEMDKRIRGRRAVWSQQEKAELDEALKKLPDLASQCEPVGLPQPAVGTAAEERSN